MLPDLAGCRVLVIEDDYFIADETSRELCEAGVDVIGPVGTVLEALELLALSKQVDAAAIDVNLHGQTSFGIADALRSRHVPFVFATACDALLFPKRFEKIEVCPKPYTRSMLIRALQKALGE